MTLPVSSATFSPCGRYRYALSRAWDASLPTVCFCGLNPSTADAEKDDPTVRREVGFAKAWGYGRYVKVNAYALRSTDPGGLWTVDDPVGPDNIRHVATEAANAKLFVAAWGNNIGAAQAFVLRTLLIVKRVDAYALRVTKQGQPAHPLYLPKTLKPFAWLTWRLP